MLTLIEEHKPTIDRLCRRYSVNRLELFGSAATGEFDPAKSDLDFLVEFLPLSPTEEADAYFGLLHELEDVFSRKVDLVVAEAIRNPFFQRAVDSERTLLYAA
jgi:uncharacterized protein